MNLEKKLHEEQISHVRRGIVRMQFWTFTLEKPVKKPNEDILYDSEAWGRGLNCRYALRNVNLEMLF